MTKQEQIEEMTKIIQSKDTAEKLYDDGYRKVPDGAVVLTPEERGDEMKATNEILEERNNLLARVGVLGREVEELKAKLEKIPLAIKQKIMEEDDYELTEREQATLFLDRMGSDLELLHDMVENLDELLGKGIDKYIMGIDGVEGLKDMWERSAVMAFAEKLKEYINNKADFVYKSECGEYAKINITLFEKHIDEMLKEYE